MAFKRLKNYISLYKYKLLKARLKASERKLKKARKERIAAQKRRY